MPKNKLPAEHEETENGVVYRLYLEYEDQNILDWMKSGDPEYVEKEKEMAAELAHRFDQGDQWAWFCAKVEAEFGGFVGTHYLGCCSYKDKKEFLDDGIWKELKPEALVQLKAEIAFAIARGNLANKALEELEQHKDNT